MAPLIVCYHAVSSTWQSQLAIHPDVLRSQLGVLHRRGYVSLTFSEAERRRLQGTLPKRAVVITFDDGFASVLRAKPILDELGYRATLFVVTSFVELEVPLRWPGIEVWLNANTARELAPLRWGELASSL